MVRQFKFNKNKLLVLERRERERERENIHTRVRGDPHVGRNCYALHKKQLSRWRTKRTSYSCEVHKKGHKKSTTHRASPCKYTVCARSGTNCPTCARDRLGWKRPFLPSFRPPLGADGTFGHTNYLFFCARYVSEWYESSNDEGEGGCFDDSDVSLTQKKSKESPWQGATGKSMFHLHRQPK